MKTNSEFDFLSMIGFEPMSDAKEPKARSFNNKTKTITISKRHVGISNALIKASGNPKGFEFYYKESKHQLVMKPVYTETEHSVPLYESSSSQSISRQAIVDRICTMRNFDKENNNLIVCAKSSKNVFNLDEKDPFFWVFDLDEGKVVTRSHRERK